MNDETSLYSYDGGSRNRGFGGDGGGLVNLVNDYQGPFSAHDRGGGGGGGVGGGGGGVGGGRVDDSHMWIQGQSTPRGRMGRRLSLKAAPSACPSLDGDYAPKAKSISMSGEDPLSYGYDGGGEVRPGAVPIVEGRVVGYGSSHGPGYSFDAVAAKIAEHENPDYHPEGPSAYPSHHQGVVTLEIAPGHYARLRGADETWACVERDFYMPVTCFACTSELCCIQDATYVLCPTCRVVSPMDGTMDPNHDGGVGLGFTMEDLLRWQAEILSKRGQSQGRHHHY
jgi:hypothetical protein